jgi:hypothetical protein
VAETFRRRKDGEEWALEMERNIDRRAAAAWTPVEDELSKPGAIERAKAGKNAQPLSDVIDRYIAESEKAIGKTKAQVLRRIKKDPPGAKACSRIDAEVICDFAKGRARDRIFRYGPDGINAAFTRARAAHGEVQRRRQSRTAGKSPVGEPSPSTLLMDAETTAKTVARRVWSLIRLQTRQSDRQSNWFIVLWAPPAFRAASPAKYPL